MPEARLEGVRVRPKHRRTRATRSLRPQRACRPGANQLLPSLAYHIPHQRNTTSTDRSPSQTTLTDPPSPGIRNEYGDDYDLAIGIKRGEPGALEELYERTAKRAFGLAYRILQDGARAEDVVQEVFLTVWRNADRIDPERGKISSYLMTMVHHKAIDALRSDRGGVRETDLNLLRHHSGGTDVAERVVQSLGHDAVRNALTSLPDDQRTPVEMAFFQGFTHVEIAEKLSIPLGTVKSRLRLAMDKLRTALGVTQIDQV